MTKLSDAIAIAQAHHRSGRLDLAEEIYGRILAVEPNHAQALQLLGAIAHQQGRFDVALGYMRRAAEANPSDPESLFNLAVTLCNVGRAAEAVDWLQRAVELRPEFVEAWSRLGNVLKGFGRFDEAVASYQRALATNPDHVEALNNLGNAWKELGRLEEATAAHRRVVELRPDLAEGYNNLGHALQLQGRSDEAVACHRAALERNPHSVHSLMNLGGALQDQGRLDDAIAAYQRAMEIDPGSADAHNSYVFAMHYRHGVSPRQLLDVYAEFDRRHAAPLASRSRGHANDRNPDRPLRLGFVSADFKRHPVGYFCLRTVECLHAKGCPTILYSSVTAEDDFTARFRAAAQAWREVRAVPDEALAEQIRADRIDILFELASHTLGNRLLMFARRPAPVQIAWAGPTGISAIDYLLADSYLVPPGGEVNCREQPVRMPDAYACYEPPAEAPPVAPLPAWERGYVTFGSLNNLSKITPRVLELWAAILRRLPSARLVIRYGRVATDPGTAARLRSFFHRSGIDNARIDLVGWAPYARRFDLYNQIDLALDPFPFSGCTTTCESLWMGVPVITCPGPTYFSRQSLSILRNVGLEEPVAMDEDDYLARAVDLAQDLPRLSAIRDGLRRRMAASALCDAPLFAENLLSRLRNVWRRWCETRTPS